MSAAVDLKRNPKQAHFLNMILSNTSDSMKTGEGAYQRGYTCMLQAGRASGKTFTLLDAVAISAFALPRALAGIGSRTFKQVLEIIISQSDKVWEQHGL